MKYTDLQLKRALARMLRSNICYMHDENIMWLGNREVFDTELLHLCWSIEQTLKDDAHYSTKLMQIIQDELCIGAVDARYKTAHATWQQRTIALAQMLKIEII